MKTIIASLVGLGLMTSIASAQSCSPYGHRPAVVKVQPVEQPVNVVPAPPQAPVEAAPAPAPVPQK